jgi:hypothetical protein
MYYHFHVQSAPDQTVRWWQVVDHILENSFILDMEWGRGITQGRKLEEFWKSRNCVLLIMGGTYSKESWQTFFRHAKSMQCIMSLTWYEVKTWWSINGWIVLVKEPSKTYSKTYAQIQKKHAMRRQSVYIGTEVNALLRNRMKGDTVHIQRYKLLRQYCNVKFNYGKFCFRLVSLSLWA